MDRASLRLGCEKRHGDGKTARLKVFSIDGSTTGPNAGLYNGESKTYAPAFAVSHSLRTVKGFEQATNSAFRYAGSLVPYHNKDFISFPLSRDFNDSLMA